MKSEEPQPNPKEPLPIKVAAYCRVSTNLKEQESSFELQKNYYNELIHERSEWKFAGIYADYAKTGTQLEGRTGFQRMLSDCREGKIDKIICKSISRFARNTIDLLESVKIIKEYGTTIYFEKEDLDTQRQYDELLLTIYAAVAQDESRNTSENVRWAYQKRFIAGIPAIQPIYGFIRKKGGHPSERNNIIVIQSEAKVVKLIFSYADKGYGYTKIAGLLNNKKIPYKDGKAGWTMERIKRILHNERYAGTVICQKYYTYDYLTHKKKENKGEKKQYRLEGYHQAIVDTELFQSVQNRLLLQKRKYQKKGRTRYPLTSMLVCENCGTRYQTYNRKNKAKWRCGRAIRRLGLCEAAPVNEAEIESAVKMAFMERYFLYDVSNMEYLKESLTNKVSVESIERDWKFLLYKIEEQERQLEHIHLNLKDEHTQRAHPVIEENILSINSNLEKLYFHLDHINNYKKHIESDTNNRERILQWIQELPADRSGRVQFMNLIVTEYMHAWIDRICVCDAGHFRFYWFDNMVTEVKIGKG